MFEIYAYGNVDTLTGVFNAIAAIMGGGLLRPHQGDRHHRRAGGGVRRALHAGQVPRLGLADGLPAVVYYALFLPKSTVVIVDKLGSQPPVAVGSTCRSAWPSGTPPARWAT